MNLITVELEGGEVALLASQVARVEPWPTAGIERVASLAELLGLPWAGPGARLLVGIGGSGAALVPARIERLDSRGGTFFAVPRVLARLGAPAWLLGFFAREGSVCPVVDLPALLGARPQLSKELA